MNLKKISYSESVTVPTERRFESRRFFVSGEAELSEGETSEQAFASLKATVKAQLAKEMKSD